MNEYMKIAIEEANKAVESGEGGPFGAVIVKDGEIVAQGHNEVIKTQDPTAHAEIVTIRKATQKLGRWNLSDCVLYSSCEPCPMCLSATHWARIPEIFYAATSEDAENAGFDDKVLYEMLQGKSPKMKMQQVDREEALEPFQKWKEKKDKEQY